MTFLLSLLGFGKLLRKWATIAFRWALASSTHLLMIACAALALWGWIGWHGKAKAEKVLASTEQAYRTAQADAKAAQDNLNLAISARYSALAKESDHEHQKALSDAHSAVVRYSGLHSCDTGKASGSNPAALPDNPGVAASPGGAPGMVAVAVADLDQLAGNTVRAESCRAWGQSMIEAGLAEKAVD